VKFNDGIPLWLLLLLSGDIELHPGPVYYILVMFVPSRLQTAIKHCAVICVTNGFTLLVTLVLISPLKMIWLHIPLQLCGTILVAAILNLQLICLIHLL